MAARVYELANSLRIEPIIDVTNSTELSNWVNGLTMRIFAFTVDKWEVVNTRVASICVIHTEKRVFVAYSILVMEFRFTDLA